MAKLNVTLKYDDLGVNTALDNQTAMLQIQSLVVSSGAESAVDLTPIIQSISAIEQSQIEQNNAINSKANQTDFDALSLIVAAKADLTTVDDLAQTASNHTAALANKADSSTVTAITSSISQANGIAPLDGNAKVPSAYLPSYVDDVLEFANLASFPLTGETGKIYVSLDDNRTYRWSGATYTKIASGAVDSVNGKTGVVTLSKTDIGLGNVDNTPDTDKNVSTATKLTTARTITFSGGVSGSYSFDGSQNATVNITIGNIDASKITTGKLTIAQGGTGASTLAEAQEALGINDNKVLNPIRIGAKWYQPGLRYTSEYPRGYNPTTMTALSGYQMWIPFVALEDATIDSLEIQCTTAVASSTVQLGLYASDDYNDLANALFISDAISCATTGAKTAPCNVSIQKGKVYWLSSLVIGTPAFYRSYSDSSQSIKGGTTAGTPNTIGYAIANMTTMPVTPPANKVDRNNAVPRVAFTVL